MAEWRLDQGWHLDEFANAILEAEVEFSMDVTYRHRPEADLDLEMVITAELEVDVTHVIALDLMNLIPEKFHSSEILQAYVKECGFQIGANLSKTRDIVKLLSPNTVSSIDYLRHLGSLIGVNFPPEDESSEAEFKDILSKAIDWYKVKGTYQAIDILAMNSGYTVNLYDMYTNDYSTFVLTDWFVGEEDENPSGLDSSYYKSPHFGVEVLLNRTYEEGSMTYLWYNNYLANFATLVEETRPVHTVPHYLIFLNPKTDEFGNVITVDGGIKAKVTANWQFGIKYFDAVGSGDAWSFDDGSMIFDYDFTSFIKSITTWVLGTGNYPSQISDSTADVQNPVLTGSIDPDDITIFDDKYSFEFIVSKVTVGNNLSELGLYIGSTLVILSTFPKINKTNDVELRVVVEIYKKDLS